jgi:hypothetical protein
MTSFLPTFREFPTDDSDNLKKQLTGFCSQTNIAVNNRTISSFQTNSIPNGESWFPLDSSNKLLDGFRVVFQISDSKLVFPHGISLINRVTRFYGSFFSGTFWGPLPYVGIGGDNISILLTSEVVSVFRALAAPNIQSGILVLEYV